MLPIEYLPGARRDFDESFDWYAKREIQVAMRFANAINSALVEVATNPARFASVDGAHHESALKKFPFRIVFRLVANRVLVVAVAHAKRRPGYWMGRS